MKKKYKSSIIKNRFKLFLDFAPEIKKKNIVGMSND